MKAIIPHITDCVAISSYTLLGITGEQMYLCKNRNKEYFTIGKESIIMKRCTCTRDLDHDVTYSDATSRIKPQLHRS